MGYDKSKIYRLICDDGHYYYGSTIASLPSRLNGHKLSSEKMTSKVYTHIRSIGWDKVKIELIESFVCENREQIRKKENEYIEKSKGDPFCLNTLPAYKSVDEKHQRALDYYMIHKEHILTRNKNYHEKNKQQIIEQTKKRYNKNRSEILNQMKEYQTKNKSIIQEQRKGFYEENKERLCKEKREKRKQMDINEVKQKAKEYRDKNRERINELKRKKYKEERNKIKEQEIIQTNE